MKLYQVAGSNAVHTPTRSGEGTRGRGIAQPEQRVCRGRLCEAPRVCVWVCWWANEHKKKHAKALAPHLQQHFGVELVGVTEGSEPAELWELPGTARTRTVPRQGLCSARGAAAVCVLGGVGRVQR